MTDININPTNINPQKWGPPFWALLHTIAQYADRIPNCMTRTLKSFVSTIPFILPCDECASHSHEIYTRLNMVNQVSFKNLKHWVWTFRTEVNKSTNSGNISFQDYLTKFQTTNIFINKKQIIDLLALMSLNYPYNDSNKMKNVYLFIHNLSSLLTYIPHLKSLNKFRPTAIWNNKIELQNWLKFKCYKVYKFNMNFDGYTP